MSTTKIKLGKSYGCLSVILICLLIYYIILMLNVASDQRDIDKRIDELNVRVKEMKIKCD